jgi:hypothetical protein
MIHKLTKKERYSSQVSFAYYKIDYFGLFVFRKKY